MPFPDAVRREARRRARFCCVVCQDFFVEVHHIQPLSEGGSQQLDNAAPLCGSCHNKFGGNAALRKQLREMRDAWWQECESLRPAREPITATFFREHSPSAHPQQVRWGPVDGLEPGITLDGMTGQFIAWEQLRVEIQARLLNQLGRSLPVGCSVALGDFHGRQNWLVRVVDPNGSVLADVWLGPDPDSGWRFDGRVRIGLALDDHHAEVWQIFERFSDGSYRRLEARA
jgi:hypothetical protein